MNTPKKQLADPDSPFTYLTPSKGPSTLKEAIQASLKTTKNRSPTCYICMSSCQDFSTSLCDNFSHIVCAQCADEWTLHRTCPVCLRDITRTVAHHKQGPQGRQWRTEGMKVMELPELSQEWENQSELGTSQNSNHNDQ